MSQVTVHMRRLGSDDEDLRRKMDEGEATAEEAGWAPRQFYDEVTQRLGGKLWKASPHHRDAGTVEYRYVGTVAPNGWAARVVEKAQEAGYEATVGPGVNTAGGQDSVVIVRRASRQALYFERPPRTYRPSREERETGRYTCPHCSARPTMRRRLIRIKMTDLGERDRDYLFQCPTCAWSIHREDIFEPDVQEVPVLQPAPPGMVLGMRTLVV